MILKKYSLFGCCCGALTGTHCQRACILRNLLTEYHEFPLAFIPLTYQNGSNERSSKGQEDMLPKALYPSRL